MTTYLSTRELASRIPYDERTIREQLKDSVLLEGVHYIRPFGRRRVAFIWEAIERDMRAASEMACGIPLTAGGSCRG